MAIDGRTIHAQASEPKRADAYESVWVRVVSAALIWVPLALVVWFAYVSGTWMGGPIAGVLSVVSTAASAAVLWLFLRARRRRH